MSTESKRREVWQLLKEYRAWHTAFGGAMPLDETGVVDASYGPAGYIEVGMYYAKRDRGRLAKSYKDLKAAMDRVKCRPLGMAGYILALSPYLGPDADPDIAKRWQRPGDLRGEWLAAFVAEVADELEGVDLYVAWPNRMTSQEEKQIERRNDELYGIYKTLRSEDRSKSQAVKEAATRCGYSERRAWDIVKTREPSSASKAC